MKSKTIKLIFQTFFLFGILSCSTENKSINTDAIVAEYYTTYQKRSDFEKFLHFYDENIILEDIINGDRIIGKAAFADFFNWNNPNFSRTDTTALVIYDQIIEGNKVVTQGYFTEFKWGETTFEAMHFTTILTFNEQGKIIKQVDWINYPASLVDYENRSNANEWIIN